LTIVMVTVAITAAIALNTLEDWRLRLLRFRLKKLFLGDKSILNSRLLVHLGRGQPS